MKQSPGDIFALWCGGCIYTLLSQLRSTRYHGLSMQDATRSDNDARSLSMATTRSFVNPSVILMSAEHAELVGVSKPCKTDLGGCAIVIVCPRNRS